MTTENTTTTETGTTTTTGAATTTGTTTTIPNDDIQTVIRDIKSKLDNAYAERDAERKKVKDLEDKARADEIKRLADEGKLVESLRAQIDDLTAANKKLADENLSLSRDNELTRILSERTFRSDNARNMTFKEIRSELVRDESGKWKHKSGVSIEDYVEKFSTEESNAFLFKAAVSTGTGSTNSGTTNTGDGTNNSTNKSKSLFQMPQSEVLKRAREGKLRRK